VVEVEELGTQEGDDERRRDVNLLDRKVDRV
jgi:hypothetical protein